MSLSSLLDETKKASRVLATIDTDKKNKALQAISKKLQQHKKEIIKENTKDIAGAKKQKHTNAFINRLTITDAIFDGIIDQIKTIISQKDPLGEIIEKRSLSNGIVLTKKRVPIGVIAVIYESRPNVTVDVAALCLKSGNAAVLKGGSEAYHTNMILVSLIQEALREVSLPVSAVTFIQSTDRAVTKELIRHDAYIDLLIPRGGYDLARFVVENSTIPLLYHSAGGARIYVDKDADINHAIDICVNAKVSRPGTCNSLDTVVIHADKAKDVLPQLEKELKKHHVEIRADERARKYIDAKPATQKDFQTEFLDYIISIKTVDSLDEAISFIQKHSKGHSEGIISENNTACETFAKEIDSAAVFINCSTRFNDGAEFGLGAEMGIATGKLHARGPVGLNEITTYQWIAEGNGHIRT